MEDEMRMKMTNEGVRTFAVCMTLATLVGLSLLGGPGIATSQGEEDDELVLGPVRLENDSMQDGKRLLTLSFPMSKETSNDDQWIRLERHGGGVIMDVDSAGTYNGFAASHLYRADDFLNAVSWDIGMILRTTGQVDGPTSGTLIFSKVARVVQTTQSCQDAVIGVFGGFKSSVEFLETRLLQPDPTNNNVLTFLPFIKVMAMGDGVILVTDLNGEVANGDYICSSTVPGYGERQTPGLSPGTVMNHTVAKAIETIDWNDPLRVTVVVPPTGPSYRTALLACIYMAG
jgi:hypothetical protein